MMNLLKLAAKNAERFDEFFLLLRDLAAEKNVRDYLLRNTGVSKLINLLLNDMSPPFLQAACGEIKNVGKTHSSNVNFANVIDTIAVLVVVNCTLAIAVVISIANKSDYSLFLFNKLSKWNNINFVCTANTIETVLC